MHLKYTFLGLSIIITLAVTACAQSKKTAGVKSGEAYAKVLQATYQRTLPGAPGTEPFDEYRILIVWNSTLTPETFFWRSEGDWIGCSVAKATKKATANSNRWYNVQEISLADIKKNDTLELLPVPGGKYPIPEAIPETATNTLFFKTAKNAWLSLPVMNIKREKDIVLP